MKLSEKAEEAAGFFAKMLDHEYTKKDIFCQNFFQDWRKVGRVRFNNDVIRNNLWGAMCKARDTTRPSHDQSSAFCAWDSNHPSAPDEAWYWSKHVLRSG